VESALSSEERRTLLAQIDARIAILQAEVGAGLQLLHHPETVNSAPPFETTDDAAIVNLEYATDIAAIQRDDHELRELNEARKRLEIDNQAGQCIDCGDAIVWARLVAMPTATTILR
jgi:DnaK suppressor protein